ncbi:orotidine-5'-phosphate decarboxylase [Roseivivax sediminis]|uniref:Orotidine 5'-phosphate decarboxylase n=1 Tax=Roseivivax sediminis TaxID=936889 RepID=A0A1I1WS75_9RHOB|nr:orotidine-5'-phosphate decarboxylase [Roseivivax sediminis]SFD98045.1 orotidine-5'-phosphate decarboxylase [Roseivivax sediminis]
MFDRMIDTLAAGDQAALDRLVRMAPGLAAGDPDRAAAYLALGAAAREAGAVHPAPGPEILALFETGCRRLDAAWQSGDAAEALRALNAVVYDLARLEPPAREAAAPATFAERFADLAARRSGFCMGMDPSPQVLRDWGLPVSVAGLADFVSIALEAAEGSVAVVKPQVAFFEAFGPAGMAELGRLISGARARGLLVIADAKRGDIGTSSAAYARAWLGPGGFDADAVTLNTYLGLGALGPVFERAQEVGGGTFVVVRSSNPEGSALQSADMGGLPLADRVADAMRERNAQLAPGGVGPVGAVIGATLGAEAARTVQRLPNALFLVPGLGQQGATMDDLAKLFGAAGPRVVPTSSRAVLAAGPRVAALKARLAEETAAAMPLQEAAAA